MKDTEIIELYFRRDEHAIEETQKSYGRYCYSIAYHILHVNEDSEECVNDTWMRTWNAIPPTRPAKLSLFLGTITRNLSLDRWKQKNALKRGSGEVEIALEELEECIPDANCTERIIEGKELAQSLNSFLGTLKERERNVFLRRYYYAEEYSEIADRYDLNLNTVKTTLFRVRGKLKEFLEREGIVF